MIYAKTLFSEKVSHFEHLVFRPLLENWKVFQKVNFFVFFPGFDFGEALLKMLSIEHSHIAILECHNSGSPWCVLEQRHLPKAVPCDQPLLIDKPLLLQLFEVCLTDSLELIRLIFVEFLLNYHFIYE